jgi:RNase H-fold protein (predicted Holliday junction resolvase)
MRALGIDLGTKSMGLAITDNDKIIVSPLRNCKFKTYDENQYIATLKEIIKINKYEDKIDLIVLGAPIQLNGSSSP